MSYQFLCYFNQQFLIPWPRWPLNRLRRRHADRKLRELFEIWRRLAEAGVLGLRQVKGEQGGSEVIMFFREDLPADEEQSEGRRAEIDRDFDGCRKLLGLDPTAREFRMKYGRVPERSDEIAVLTGSIWDIMLNLAWQFDVPEEHLESGRTASSFHPDDSDSPFRIEVLFSKEEPEDTYVAVRAHGYWFYIDQNDSLSKRTFSFLQLLLNLSETGTSDPSPVVTISN